VHRPRSNFHLHFGIKYTHQIRTEKHNARAWRLLPASPPQALAARYLHEDHVWITTDELFRSHKNEFNETPCKLVFFENPRSFEKYLTLPQVSWDLIKIAMFENVGNLALSAFLFLLPKT